MGIWTGGFIRRRNCFSATESHRSECHGYLLKTTTAQLSRRPIVYPGFWLRLLFTSFVPKSLTIYQCKEFGIIPLLQPLLQTLQLFLRQVSPFPQFEISQMDIHNSDPLQAHDFMTAVFDHPPNLPVEALGQNDLE